MRHGVPVRMCLHSVLEAYHLFALDNEWKATCEKYYSSKRDTKEKDTDVVGATQRLRISQKHKTLAFSDEFPERLRICLMEHDIVEACDVEEVRGRCTKARHKTTITNPAISIVFKKMP